MDDNEDRRANEDDKIYKIIFEKKNTRANIRMGINLGIILIIALIVVGVFFNFIIKYKYGDVIEEVKKSKFNRDTTVITDYSFVMEEVAKSLVIISDETDKNNSVTGTIITKEGLIITSYSAVKEMNALNVTLNKDSKNVLKGKLMLKNEDFDLALVQIEYEGELTPIAIADSEEVVEGQGIAIVGSIFNDEKELDSIVPGIISLKYNKVKDNNELSEECNLIQINAPVNTNNTGGPICNAKGELIGLASLYLTEQYKTEGLYYGVQLSSLDNLVNSNVIIKDVLGIAEGGIIINEEHEYKGFYVGQLIKNGNAYRAEIKPTDIILSIDDVDIINVDEITNILSNKNKGDSLNCRVLSDGLIKNVVVKLYS